MSAATLNRGAIMDVVVWLRSLGLGKYEAVFRDNDIDETVLPSLTHEYLKELGVASFGHCVKLLDAIAALRNDASRKAPSIDAHQSRGQVDELVSDSWSSVAAVPRVSLTPRAAGVRPSVQR